MKIANLIFHVGYEYASGDSHYHNRIKKITYTWDGPKTGIILVSGSLYDEAIKTMHNVKPPLFVKQFFYDYGRDAFYCSRIDGLYMFVWLYYWFIGKIWSSRQAWTRNLWKRP